MDSPSFTASPGDNPLLDDSPEVWDRLVEALSPAAMLCCIRLRMSHRLQGLISPEDLWQETLLHVWRDRSSCRWEGVGPFRRWVLSVAENRIRNAADRVDAQKRGGGHVPASLETERDGAPPPPVTSTTPSRVASYAEEAEVMRCAVERLPEELRDVVRLRLFEEQSVEEVAQVLGIGVSAVKHRFRKGAGQYHEELRWRLASRSDARGGRPESDGD